MEKYRFCRCGRETDYPSHRCGKYPDCKPWYNREEVSE